MEKDCRCIFCGCAAKRALNLQILVRKWIHQAQHDNAIFGRSGNRKIHGRFVFVRCCRVRFNFHGGLTAVSLEQREGVISGRAHALLPLRTIRQQQRLKHVHDLRDVAHEEFVGLAVENVQSQSCCRGAAHGALLPQFAEFLFVFGGDAVPNSPFIQDQRYLAPVAVAIKQRTLLRDGFFNSRKNGELLFHMLRAEMQRMIFPALVIVHGDAFGRSPFERVHELARPARIVSIRAAGNQERFRVAVLPQIN